jgi:mannose/cellobiose epimerase-like protein (N-acyl-D-glucosamine 2-epimerase family)
MALPFCISWKMIMNSQRDLFTKAIDMNAVIRLSACILLILGLALPSEASDIGRRVDREWFRKTLAAETAHWRDAAFTPEGFFKVNLDRRWRQVGSQNGTLVSQSRQIFVMAQGYELTREASYLEAVRKGADFLLERFRDFDQGLFFYSMTPEGKVLDPGKSSYGLAFVIFALSHAGRVTGDDKYKKAALETWKEMKVHLRDKTGFFKPKTDRSYGTVIGQNTQNPMMHLFEALLALYDGTQSTEILKEAGDHAHRIFTRLYQEREGRLPEIYDTEWRPAATTQRGCIELGHQFEWAFLLSHGVEKGMPGRYLGIAERLLDYGMKVGFDSQEGGTFSRSDYNGKVIRGPKGWWEQCESLRAMMHWAELRGRVELWSAFDKSFAFVRDHFIDLEYGGWYSAYDPANRARGSGKGSVWQVGYHVCGFYAEALRLLRLAGAGPR